MLHNKVYDLTKWASTGHPGGPAVFTTVCGTSDLFEAAVNGKHTQFSQYAKFGQVSAAKGVMAPEAGLGLIAASASASGGAKTLTNTGTAATAADSVDVAAGAGAAEGKM